MLLGDMATRQKSRHVDICASDKHLWKAGASPMADHRPKCSTTIIEDSRFTMTQKLPTVVNYDCRASIRLATDEMIMEGDSR